MIAPLDHVAGCKFGFVTGANPCAAYLNHPITALDASATAASSSVRTAPLTLSKTILILRFCQPDLNARDERASCPKGYRTSHMLSWPHGCRVHRQVQTDGCLLVPHILKHRRARRQHIGQQAPVLRSLLRSARYLYIKDTILYIRLKQYKGDLLYIMSL